MSYISVVAPIFNESELINEFTKQVTTELEKIHPDYELIFVDDGSTDNSWEIIQELVRRESRILGIKFSKNFGHHYAITAGLNNSNGEWTIVMDSDLQDRPQVIPKLIDKALEGYDVVFVSRVDRPESLVYKVTQKMFYSTLNLLSGLKLDSTQANFSVLNRKVVEAFKQFPEQARFYGSTVKWLGFKRTSIKAQHGIRYSGSPSYTFKKRLTLASDIILSFSDRPLKFAIGLGTGISTLSVLVGGWILLRSLIGNYAVQGWSSLIVTIFFSTGVILIILGINGIYLSKIFNEVKSRPLYIIESIFKG